MRPFGREKSLLSSLKYFLCDLVSVALWRRDTARKDVAIPEVGVRGSPGIPGWRLS